MTLSEISRKIFKANLRKYLLLFLCGSFAVMIFFAYASLYADPVLPRDFGFDKSILYAPGLVISVFSVLFMMYAQSSYARFRLREFGLLLTLGMTKADVWKVALAENGLVSGLSLVFGILAGTLFSRLLVFIISIAVGINAHPPSFTLASCWYTLLFFLAVFVLTTASTILAVARQELLLLLKRNRLFSRSLVVGPIFAILGALLLVASLLDAGLHRQPNQGTVLLRSSLTCLVGLYLGIANRSWFAGFATKIPGANRYRNLVSRRNLQHSFAQTRNVVFAIALLLGVSIFFTSLCVLILSDAERVAAGYNPFDIAYAEIGGQAELPPAFLDEQVRTTGTRLKSASALEFVRASGLLVVSSENLGAATGTSIEVQRGGFILLVQTMLDDNHPHDEPALFRIAAADIGGRHYSIQGELVKVLFNNVDAVTRGGPACLVVSGEDYLAIKAGRGAPPDVGRVVLLRFEDWRRTKALCVALVHELGAGEADSPAGRMPRASSAMLASRVDFYEQKVELMGVTLFLFAYTSLLFFLASLVMLHFKLLLEFQNETSRYRRLFKLGVTRKEVRGMVNGELRTLFLLPSIVGALLGLFFAFSMPMTIGNRMMAIGCSALIVSFALAIQGASYLVYRRMYAGRLMASVGMSA